MKKVVVSYPMTQNLENKEGFFENVELINSDKGIELYGAGSYLVNEEWLEKVNNGVMPIKEYTEKDMMYGLKCNNTFPIQDI